MRILVSLVNGGGGGGDGVGGGDDGGGGDGVGGGGDGGDVEHGRVVHADINKVGDLSDDLSL